MISKDEYYPFIDSEGLASIYEREGWDKRKLMQLFDFLKRINSLDTFECWADTGCVGKMNVLGCGSKTSFISIFDIGEGEPSGFTLFDGKSETIDMVAKVTVVERQVNEISIAMGNKSINKCICSDELQGVLEMIADGLLNIQEKCNE